MTDSRIKVLVYSHDRTMRSQVRNALGSRIAADLPPVEIFEVATGPALLRDLDLGNRYDLIIMDGEARPVGSYGLARQIKDEYSDAPAVLIVMARVSDAWMGTWSGAEALASYPLDPVTLPQQVADVVRRAPVR